MNLPAADMSSEKADEKDYKEDMDELDALYGGDERESDPVQFRLSEEMEKKSVTPPGKEDMVRELKKDPDVEEPYAVAWGSYLEEHPEHKKGSIRKLARVGNPIRKIAANAYDRLSREYLADIVERAKSIKPEVDWDAALAVSTAELHVMLWENNLKELVDSHGRTSLACS